MSPTDVLEIAARFGNVGGSVVLLAATFWFAYRRASGWFKTNDAKLDALAAGQAKTNEHLETLNGTVAKHQEDHHARGGYNDRLAYLEGQTGQPLGSISREQGTR